MVDFDENEDDFDINMLFQAIREKIDEISFSHVKHKGLDAFKNERGIINIANIPGISISSLLKLIGVLTH